MHTLSVDRTELAGFRPSALVVEPSEEDAIRSVCALTSVGFTVTLADNFHQAKALLDMQPPLVLVTEVRLGAYNGLQLALRHGEGLGRPAAIVMSAFVDSVLQQEAERAGATFVVKPVPEPELVAAVYRTLMRQQSPDGVVHPIRPPFERRTHERRTAIVSAIDADRRHADRRRDILGLMVRAGSGV
jgi:DNA-binding response OmpR family regulator